MEMNISPVADNLVKVQLAGSLDAAAVDRIETRLIASIVPEGRNAIIDLSKVEYIASLGIRMLVATARSLQLKHKKVALYGVSGPISSMFETVALSQLVAICTTEAEALESVGVAI